MQLSTAIQLAPALSADELIMKSNSVTLPQEPVYADLHHSTNPPAPPLPVEPAQCATMMATGKTSSVDVSIIILLQYR